MDTTTRWSVSLGKSSRRSTITLWIFFQLMKEGKFRWCGKSIHGTNTFSNKGSVMEMIHIFKWGVLGVSPLIWLEYSVAWCTTRLILFKDPWQQNPTLLCPYTNYSRWSHYCHWNLGYCTGAMHHLTKIELFDYLEKLTQLYCHKL